MRRLFTLVSLLLLTIYGCNHHDNSNVYSNKHKPDDYTVKIHVPDKWINELRRFNYTRDDSTQLRDFDNIIKPDGPTNPHAQHVDPGYGRVFNAMSVDLDSDGNDEIICLLGWDIYFPALCVFKQEEGEWFLIYMEEIETAYASPTLYAANNFSKNKAFYLKYVQNHGTGVYEDRWSFYKLINNRVYKCLDLLNEAEGVGYAAKVNEKVQTSFEFSGDDSDGVWVKYKYNFFPGSFDNNSCDWCSNEDVPLIAGEGDVNYKWDKKSLTYKLDILSYQNQVDDLTAEKIECFGTFVEDTVFVKAFKDQIDEKLKTGTPLQKKILKKYLELVKRDKKAIP
jgi:hypothetical protein